MAPSRVPNTSLYLYVSMKFIFKKQSDVQKKKITSPIIINRFWEM